MRVMSFTWISYAIYSGFGWGGLRHGSSTLCYSEIDAVVNEGCGFEFCLGKNKNLLVKKYLFVVKWWLKWNTTLVDSISKGPYCSSLLILMICIYGESQMKYILCIFVYSILFLLIFFYMDAFYRLPHFPPCWFISFCIYTCT